jgi:F0F1-type ATP synthase membrane subunit b/b'
MLREANEEAERILSSSPSLDDAKAECEAILADARARAEKTAEESRRQADRIRDRAKNRDREKVDRIVREATAIVRGTE